MSKTSTLFLLGVLIFIGTGIMNYIFPEIIPYSIVFGLFFLSCCLMLPHNIHDVQDEETWTDWKILIANVIASLMTFTGFIICLRRGV